MPSDRFDDIFSAAKKTQPEKKNQQEKETQLKEEINLSKVSAKAKRGNPAYGNYSVLIPKTLRRKIKRIQGEYEDETGEEIEYSEIVELLLSMLADECDRDGVEASIRKLKSTQ